MEGRKILLGVTGGIAAYKSAELCRLLVKRGADLRVVMSEAATEFITPLTLETLSGKPVPHRMFGRAVGPLEHIEVPDEAEVMVIAPATADYIARCAAGRACDLISSVTLAFTGPVLFAPAMNTNMWNNPATRRNVRTLIDEHGWSMIDPGEGDLACGWTGPGRMADPPLIVDAIAGALRRDLEGRRLLVTAGPTVEDIDPVRFLSNRSTGKMGYAIARAAARRGAGVTLISGPTPLAPPAGVEFLQVRSALEMQASVDDRAQESDAVVMAAAVADYRPAKVARGKIKKSTDEKEARAIELVRNPDILAALGDRFARSDRPILVGFAVETEALLESARGKLRRKGASMIVANLARDSFGKDDNRAYLIKTDGEVDTGVLPKDSLAEKILDAIAEMLPPGPRTG